MGLNKHALKGLIEYSDLRNEAGLYNEDDVTGVSTSKDMIATKANLDGVNLLNYKLFPPKSFAYVADTSRRGDKIALTYNDTNKTFIVSTWYVVFHLTEKAKSILLPEYLFLFFNRAEFDRYARANSWGSAREYFWFEDMEDVIINLPSIEQQQKYVDVYSAMQKNILAYQSKTEELKLVCDGYIEELRRQLPCEAIGHYIQQKKEKNSDKKISDVWGVSTTRQFIEASSAVDKNNLSNYKIVDFGDIAYVPTTHLKVYAIAISDKKEPFVVSPIYEVFAVKDKNRLDPEYLYLWLCRDETMRYAFYNSWGSARENFNYDDMCTVKIPIPSIEIQKDIVNIHRCYIERQRISATLKEQLNNLCPILIKGSLQTND